jgi:hypothetical protein
MNSCFHMLAGIDKFSGSDIVSLFKSHSFIP